MNTDFRIKVQDDGKSRGECCSYVFRETDRPCELKHTSLKPVEVSRVCKCSVEVGLWKPVVPGRGGNTAIPGTGLVFFPDRICGLPILAELFVFALVVYHRCVPSEQQLTAEGGSGTTPQMFDSALELDRCFLVFNLQDHLGRFVLLVSFSFFVRSYSL